MAYTYNDAALTAVTGAFNADDYFGLDGAVGGPRRVLCSRFVLNDQSYANPSWITSLAAAKITGLATSATTDTTNAANISSGTLPAGRLPAFTGDATSTAGTSALTLANSGVTSGVYGSASAIPVITVDTKGRLTSVSTTAVSIPSGSLSFSGDVTGTGTTGTTTALTLANSGVTAGTYAKVTVDAKGRVTTGASLASADLPTYTGTITSSQVTTALGYTPVSTGGSTMTGDLTVTRVRGVNSLVLNSYATVNPSSNVYLYSQPNDRDSWIFLDSADTTSNWGIYHRQIDSAVSGLPANSIGFVGGGNSALKAYISLADGTANFAGALTQAGNQVLHAGNYTSYSPSLTGSGASGTWSINVSGTANNITAYTINQNLGTANQVTFDSVITGNNGNGTNVRIGDDAWFGDINLANTVRLMGNQNNANGYIVFGNGDATALGRAGTGALTYGGNTIYHAGNISSASISSSQVTTALGFTPYNSTNPNGYTSNTGTVTSVGGTGTVSGLTLTGTVTTSGNLTLGGTLSLTSANVTGGLGYTPENPANKGAANGYASLDSGGKVPSTQLPSYVDDVLEYTNTAGFPASGETGKIYVALDTNKTYRWSGTAYIEISASPGSTDAVAEGSTNLYFTNARARAAISASGSLSYNSSTGVISFTDAVTSVFGRTGAVTLSSSDVTTALGFSPYNSTNPNGYITNSGSTSGSAGSVSFGGNLTANTSGTVTAGITVNGVYNNGYPTSYGNVISIGGNGHGQLLIGWSGTTGAHADNYIRSLRDSNINTNNWSGWAKIFTDANISTAPLTSSQVTTALGFTPYSSTNPNGYTNNTGTVTSVTGTGTVSGLTLTGTVTSSGSLTLGGTLSLTSANVTTALGFTPYNSTNPNGYITSSGSISGNAGSASYLNGTGNNSSDLNTFLGAGSVGWVPATTNRPAPSYGTVLGFLNSGTSQDNSGNWLNQIGFGTDGSTPYFRQKINAGSFTAWTQFLSTANYNSYAPTLTGTGASGTWGISISGNAATATSAGNITGGNQTGSYQVTGGQYTRFGHGNQSDSNDGVIGAGIFGSGLNIVGTQTVAAQGRVIRLWGSLMNDSGTSYVLNSGTWGISISGTAATATSANALNASNNYQVNSIGVGIAASGTSGSISLNQSGIRSWSITPTGGNLDIASGDNNGAVRFNGNTLLHSGNYNSYSPTLTGSGASGTWAINVTGNSASATTTDNINGRAFYNRDSGNGLGQDSYTVNGVGYVTGVSLFGQGDGGIYTSAYSTSWVHQIYGDFRTGQIAVRGKNNGTWQAWRAVLDASNYNSYAPSLTGSGASGTWGINITGNAATATKAATIADSISIDKSSTDLNNVTSTGFFRGVSMTNAPDTGWWWVMGQSHDNTGSGSAGWNHQLAIAYGAGNTYGQGTMMYRARTGGTGYSSWNTILTSANYTSYAPSLTGSGASGTWGISVTGSSASCTGNAANVTGTVAVTNGGTGATSASAAATNLGLGTGNNVTFSTVSDSLGNVRAIPQQAKTAAYTLAASDSGQHISITTGGVTVPASVFSVGQVVTVYNNSAGSQTITQGTSVTMYLAGTATTGNRTLAQRGICTLVCVAANTFVISGGGLT